MPTIPLDRVRAHIRQDETFDDAILETYVQAGIAAAEAYLETSLSRQEFDGEADVTSAGIITLNDNNVDNLQVLDEEGDLIECRQVGYSRYQVDLPACGGYLNDPFRYSDAPFRVRVRYQVGPSDADPLDPIIELGVLKFIAHVYSARGDESNNSGQVGLNSSVVSSGAAELWNMRKSIAFAS